LIERETRARFYHFGARTVLEQVIDEASRHVGGVHGIIDEGLSAYDVAEGQFGSGVNKPIAAPSGLSEANASRNYRVSTLANSELSSSGTVGRTMGSPAVLMDCFRNPRSIISVTSRS
jgi:hypothetical protein